jgi:hypothetical protein
VLLTGLVSFSVADVGARGRPTWSHALDRARSECLRNHRATVRVTIAPRSWHIPLACSTLTRR